jgi:hypothetical protein
MGFKKLLKPKPLQLWKRPPPQTLFPIPNSFLPAPLPTPPTVLPEVLKVVGVGRWLEIGLSSNFDLKMQAA